MNVKTERTNDAKAIVTVEVEEERVQSAMRAAAQRISRIRPVHGFRPGKAPYEMVERMVGRDFIRHEAIEEVARSVYQQVLKDEKIEPYDAGQLDIEQKEPLVLKFTVPTRPSITLGNYRALALQPRAVTVSEDQVHKLIENLRENHAELAPVERPVQAGDSITFDLLGGLPDKEPVDSKGMQATVDKSSSTFPWIEQVIGASAGEARQVSYTFPDGASAELAGKVAQYTITISDVKERQLPAVNDDLAKMVGEFETLEQLQHSARESIREQMLGEEENRFADEVIDTIVEQSQIAYPAVMLEDQVDQEISRQQRLATQLGLAWDKFLQLSGKDGATLREELKPTADRKVKRLLTILELVKAENITVTREEVNAEIDRQVAYAVAEGGKEAQARRQLNSASTRKDIELNLKMRAAVNRMIAIAKGEPTSGKILTPDMIIAEQRARERAVAQSQAAAAPTGLITDPAQVRGQSWVPGLQKPMVPGQE